jgi:dTMP kinase
MLVTLEGLDGSGKSTVAAALGPPTVPEDTLFTREPTDSWYGEAVRRSLSDPDADPLAELFLFTADHAAHLAGTVRPALAAGRPVVSDRYSDSRYAYQAASLAADGRMTDPLSYVKQIHEPFTRPPDRTVYLDVPPAVAAERAGTTDKMERRAYLERVHEQYERLVAAEPDRFVRVDATRPPGAVLADVEAVLAGLF